MYGDEVLLRLIAGCPSGLVLRMFKIVHGQVHPWRPRGCESISSQDGRASGDIVLQDYFQTVAVILASDWCQKIFVFFCPIRVKCALESFRVF